MRAIEIPSLVDPPIGVSQGWHKIGHHVIQSLHLDQKSRRVPVVPAALPGSQFDQSFGIGRIGKPTPGATTALKSNATTLSTGCGVNSV